MALRFYTTFAYRYMNDPLRNDARCADGQSCPLPVATYFAVEGIRKLRALHVAAEGCDSMGNPVSQDPETPWGLGCKSKCSMG